VMYVRVEESPTIYIGKWEKYHVTKVRDVGRRGS
jgi:hypothetical protein